MLFIILISLMLPREIISAPTVLLNSSLEEGKGPACPNSNITFFCIAREVSSLRWMIGDTIITTIAYLSNENYTKVTDIYYIEAKLIKRGCVAPARTVCIINSTLTLRKDLSLNIMDTEIICEARTASLQVIRSLLTITNLPPSPPQNLSYQIISTSCHSSRVQFNWLPPENDDGQGNIDIDHYYISIQNTTLASYVQYDTPDEQVWIDVVHDVLYDFNVTASNCGGQFRSKAANLRIKIGCEWPQHLPRGHFEGQICTGEGHRISRVCEPGWTIIGTNSSVCIMRQWLPDPTSFICQRDCGSPNTHAAVSVYYDNSTVEDSEIVYQCSRWFDLQDKRKSVCTSNGEWVPDPLYLECNGLTIIAIAISIASLAFIFVVTATTVTAFCCVKLKSRNSLKSESPQELTVPRPYQSIELREQPIYDEVGPGHHSRSSCVINDNMAYAERQQDTRRNIDKVAYIPE